MTRTQLENKANSLGVTPLEAYKSMHPNAIAFKRGSMEFTFRHKETNNLYIDVHKVTWDDAGDIVSTENCLFFAGDYNECSAYFAAGTIKQVEKLSKWLTANK
jgi:hypothetical protein